MTEEEYFRKNYPNACYGDKPLSPYWDYFQEGVEFGEREFEEKITDLEQKLEQTEKDLADYQFNYPTIKELQKENAELKEKIKTLTIHDTNAVLSGLEMKVLKESHRDRANKTQEQLTKAKELLKEYYSLTYGETMTGLRSRTEQFLNEVDK